MPWSSMRHEASFLSDILTACHKIEAIVSATNEESFIADEVMSAAVALPFDRDRGGHKPIV